MLYIDTVDEFYLNFCIEVDYAVEYLVELNG